MILLSQPILHLYLLHQQLKLYQMTELYEARIRLLKKSKTYFKIRTAPRQNDRYWKYKFFSSYHDLELPIAIRKGIRQCTQILLLILYPLANFSPKYTALISNLDSLGIPRSIYEAFKDTNSALAMRGDESINKYGTWELVNRPKREEGGRLQMGVHTEA